jgi:hypothetical protein
MCEWVLAERLIHRESANHNFIILFIRPRRAPLLHAPATVLRKQIQEQIIDTKTKLKPEELILGLEIVKTETGSAIRSRRRTRRSLED